MTEQPENKEIEIELEDQTETDQYSGQPIDPDLIPQDPVQLDHEWFTPSNEKRNKGLITKNTVLANLREKDIRKLDLNIELINLLDGIILDMKKRDLKNGLTLPQIQEKISPLLLARNDIAIEHDSMQAASRALNGQAQLLSRTNRQDIKYSQKNTLTQEPKKTRILP